MYSVQAYSISYSIDIDDIASHSGNIFKYSNLNLPFYPSLLDIVRISLHFATCLGKERIIEGNEDFYLLSLSRSRPFGLITGADLLRPSEMARVASRVMVFERGPQMRKAKPESAGGSQKKDLRFSSHPKPLQL